MTTPDVQLVAGVLLYSMGFTKVFCYDLKYFTALNQSDLHSEVLNSLQIFLIVHVFVEEVA